MNALLSFAAALVSLRLGSGLLGRWRARRAPELAAWAAGLIAFAVASAALAWSAAAGWDSRSFRVYYLFGGLLSAPLLGIGSLLLAGRRWAAPLGFAYVGLAVGIGTAVPLRRVGGPGVPAAAHELAFVPGRLVALLGNSLGTLAVVGVALATFRRRRLGNTLIVTGVGLAAAGSGLPGLSAGATAACLAGASLVLYLGFRGTRPLVSREKLTSAGLARLIPVRTGNDAGPCGPSPGDVPPAHAATVPTPHPARLRFRSGRKLGP